MTQADDETPSGLAGPTDASTGAEDGASDRRDQAGEALDVHAYIGRQLRAVYDDVVKQPIPDRFLALMKQLEERDGPHS